jgi:adenosylhomocysteine nucleosidase
MIRLLVALPAEARPLIDHYHLETHHGQGPFPVYSSPDIHLVIGGIGGFNAIAATAFLQGLTQDQAPGAWLNFGICGHRDHPVGTALMAHKVRDAVSGQCSYPTFPFKAPCATAELVSVTRPVTDYPDACAYDMEGAAYWPTARRFAGVELNHCVKIVSDNPHSSIDTLTPKKVTQICADHLALLDDIIETLQDLSLQGIAPHPLAPSILSRWHFTATQQIQLKNLLGDRALLVPEEKDLWPQMKNLPNSRQVLAFLQSDNRSLPPPI